MFRNYFYLLRLIKDSNPLIAGEKISEIFTQEKDLLFIRLSNITGENLHLVISTNPQFPYLSIKDDHHKAKRNFKNFFNDLLPDIIQKMEIALGDRIVKFSLENSSIYFLIRGAETNVCVIDKYSNIRSFKKADQKSLETIKTELLNTKFIDSLEAVLELFINKSKEEIIGQYKFVDKNIINEAAKRSGDWNKNLIDIIREIYNSTIIVMPDENSVKPIFAPLTFYNFPETNIFSDYFSAINKYISLYYSIGKDKILKNELGKFIDNELERLSNKLNNLKSRIEAGSNDQEYFIKANLLLSNIHQLKKGMKEIEVVDTITNQKVKIALKENLSPQKNIDQYFEKTRSEKINYQKSNDLFLAAEKEYKRFISLKGRVENSSSIDELLSIKKELKIQMKILQQDRTEPAFNFRHYIIDGKYHIFIGRDGKNNDLLTTKFAKQNDLWFHARSVPGSHAVLRIENTKEAVPKSVLKKAASLAAFYSKARTSKLAPVAYTLKKYVVKKKDLDPGQVILLKENVMLVPPEIPSGCEMAGDE